MHALYAKTTTSGGLAGVVTDRSGAVVPNTHVEIKDDAKGITQVTNTDQEGVYRFYFLAPSCYSLTVTHDGFQEERRLVRVLVGPPTSANITLAIAESSTTFIVTSEAPLLQTENGDFSMTMNEKQITELPNLVTTSPTLRRPHPGW